MQRKTTDPEEPGIEPFSYPPDHDRPTRRRLGRRTGAIDLPRVRDKVYGVQSRGPARLPARLQGVSKSAGTAAVAHPSGDAARRQDSAARLAQRQLASRAHEAAATTARGR